MRNNPPSLGLPYGPGHTATVESYEGVIFYERDTLVLFSLRAPRGALLTASETCLVGSPRVQGYLAHNKHPPPKTLQQDCTWEPMVVLVVVLGGGAVFL